LGLSISGNCGCFDLLELLGVNIILTPNQEKKIFNELGIVFLLAPSHHPSLRHVAQLRKDHGKKTIFNLIGPLCNPASVSLQLIGSGNEEHADIIANALKNLGTEHSMIVTGKDGLDEVTLTMDSIMRNVTPDAVTISEFSPVKHSINLVSAEEIEGGTPEENMNIFLELSKGRGTISLQNLIIVNAAHAILLTSLVSSIEEAINLASVTLKSGAVFDLFTKYKEYTLSI